MLFTELDFLIFFVAVFTVHWVLRSQRARKVWLLFASYYFYAAWDWRFAFLILGSTLLDFTVGKFLGRATETRRRKLLLGVSLTGNLGLLGLFKYYDFFMESGAGLLVLLGFEVEPRTLGLIIPVGISFYTFQTLSYTLDIYRRDLDPIDSLPDFALFVSFFPQLVAGPIVRAREFLPQINRDRSLSEVQFKPLAFLFLVGFIKKACLADHAAAIADPVFANPTAFDAASNLLSLALWHVQLYGDFSGYSDMAIATAGFFGYRLPKNFDFPYFARNMAEFWRRWHISLSSWLRDYLFISLGGSRMGPVRAYVNILVTMTGVGLWHGADWQFVAFGLLCGIYLAVARAWGRSGLAEGALGRAVHFLGVPITTACFFFSWIIFRASSPENCLDQIATVFTFESVGSRALDSRWWLFFGACGLVHWLFYRGIGKQLARTPALLQAIALGVGFALALQWRSIGYQPFIYFQF